MSKYKVCLITADSEITANKIAEVLIMGKLAACVNIIPKIKSVYWWNDKIEKSEEYLLVVKTKDVLIKDVIQVVKEHHTYSIPEVIFTDITDGNEDYLNWIGANTLFNSNISKDEEIK
jgi:periplasmic divalent cation tolerance protein